jgi:hypothetical protein
MAEKQFVQPLSVTWKTTLPTYQNVDKIIGKSADEKWSNYHQKQELKDKIRKENNTHALAKTSSGEYIPVKDTAVIEERKTVYSAYRESIQNGSISGDTISKIDALKMSKKENKQ